MPRVRCIRGKKKTHKQACGLVICLCCEMASLPLDEAAILLVVLFLRAVEHDVVDIFELMMEKYPLVMGSKDDKGRTAMHLAVIASKRLSALFTTRVDVGISSLLLWTTRRIA